MRLIRTVLAAMAAAVLGVVLGRLVAGMRREAQGGEPFDVASLRPSPQEVVPGLVAALRAQDSPWSALHIPPWLAAFTVNLAMTAIGREIAPLLRSFGLGGEEPEASSAGDIWTVDASAGTDAVRPAAEDAMPGFRPFAT
jgi:hypothetical protein